VQRRKRERREREKSKREDREKEEREKRERERAGAVPRLVCVGQTTEDHPSSFLGKGKKHVWSPILA
jgi:hypothetical protein